MATLEYNLSVDTNNTDYTYTGNTADLTGYRTVITIATNTDCYAKIQYSDDEVIWDDYTPTDESSAEFSVNTTTVTKTVRLSKYIRVGVQNKNAETDTVTIDIDATSDVTTYCDAEDVARLIQAWDHSSGGRLAFSASTYPTLTEVKELIYDNEDVIDELTGHAWRTRRVTNEYHDYMPPVNISRFDRYRDNRSIKLNHRQIRTLTSGTDTIEIWDGTDWTDYVANKTSGRANDYWVDYTNGIFYFGDSRPSRTGQVLKASYNYGDSTVPKDIRKACTLMTAIDILNTYDLHTSTPDGVDAEARIARKIDHMQKQLDRIINHRKEIKMVYD